MKGTETIGAGITGALMFINVTDIINHILGAVIGATIYCTTTIILNYIFKKLTKKNKEQ